MRVRVSVLARIPNSLLDKLLVRRWWIIAGLSFGAFLLEILEHRPWDIRNSESSFLWEVLLYNLVLPLIFGAWLSLVSSNYNISRTVSRLNLQQEMRQQLAQATSWEELASALLQAPRAILPISGDSLTLLEETTGKNELSQQWIADGHTLPDFFPSPYSSECPLSQDALPTSGRGFFLCMCAAKKKAGSGSKVYCIRLAYSSQLQGWIHLYIPPKIIFQEDQIKMMESLGFEMSLAIENYKLRSWYESHSKTIEAERQSLARNLHDTIANDLAYLRLKLDQFSNKSSLSGQETFQEEMVLLSEIAQRSYDQVRISISGLQEKTAKTLVGGIQECADAVVHRAHLKVDISISGEEKSFPPHVSRQILLIIREAFRNVEKHANAQHTDVHLNWRKDALEIQIRDDGQGFDPALIASEENSYGLRFMQEAVDELDGRFSISSSKGYGTQINFCFPTQ